MHRIKIALITAALALTIGAATVAAGGPNLVKNGKFNTSNLWTPLDETTVLSVEAGRLKVENTDASGTYSNAWAMQCVQVTPGASYKFNIDVLEPAGQPRYGSAYVDIPYFSGPDCGGSLVGADSTDVASDGGDWTHFTLNLQAPAGAQSLRVDLVAAKGAAVVGQPADGGFHAFFDNASLTSIGGKKAQQ